MATPATDIDSSLSRRDFIKVGATAATAAATQAIAAPVAAGERRPNILFVHTDQQSLDTISALGCKYVSTPNMDRLAARGVAFAESYSANPVCCPARAAWYTGRATSETGVLLNGLPIQPDMPDMGQWLRDAGYESTYAGKWHVSHRNHRESFNVIQFNSAQGEHCDGIVSRACQGFLSNYRGEKPFFLNVGFLQPHDICYWIRFHYDDPGKLRYPEIEGELPPLPPNFEFDEREPETFRQQRENIRWQKVAQWSELHWRYYLWSYYRHVEMVDAELGRILDALEESKHRDHTVVVFAADHGEGMARHKNTLKGYLYDEAARVPMIVSWPGRVREGVVDRTHLVSGLDVAPTLCDYAGAAPPPKARGMSLRPLLEGSDAKWRDFLVSESSITGRMVRTADHKLITYKGDQTDQLFDMKRDPWETKNLAPDAAHAGTLRDMHELLDRWEDQLDPVPEPKGGWRSLLRKKGRRRGKAKRRA